MAREIQTCLLRIGWIRNNLTNIKKTDSQSVFYLSISQSGFKHQTALNDDRGAWQTYYSILF